MARSVGWCGLAAVVVAQVAVAQSITDDPARRRQVLPSIRGATDCIAREALIEPGILEATRQGRIVQALGGPINRCRNEIDNMIRQHDLIYFYGSGDKFFRGAYIDDLPRAVQARISGELSRRLAEEDRQRAEERRRAEERAIEARRREERERAEDERRRVDERRREAEKEAEARRRAAERQLEIERLETERQAEIAKREAIKRERLAAIDKANGVLRDIVLDCIRREMDSIVKSGEAAEVLANVSMTLCAKEIDRTVDGLITYQQIERDTAAFSSSQSEMLRAAAKGALREQVVAVAVKAKAARASGPTTY